MGGGQLCNANRESAFQIVDSRSTQQLRNALLNWLCQSIHMHRAVAFLQEAELQTKWKRTHTQLETWPRTLLQ
jgi:hypothetical protein